MNHGTLQRHVPVVANASRSVPQGPWSRYARLIEILHTCESMEKLLNEPDILSLRVRAHAEPNQLEGIGDANAPRGTLIHHYTIDDNGLIRSANLIIATGSSLPCVRPCARYAIKP